VEQGEQFYFNIPRYVTVASCYIRSPFLRRKLDRR